mgnify:CR=1 FL=1
MTKSATREAADKVTFTQTEVTSAITAGDTAARAGRKNFIINGGFDVWQRGTSLTTGSYASDRWVSAGSMGTASRQDAINEDAISSKYYMRQIITSSALNNEILQRVEGVGTLAGKTVTLSFMARSTAGTSQPLNVKLYQNFGTGGSPSALVGATLTSGTVPYTPTTSWVKYSFTYDLPSISGKTLGSNGNDFLWVRVGQYTTTATDTSLDIAEVQLELGSVATDFEHRSFGEILADCQRYYEIIKAASAWSWTSSTGARIYGQFRTEKRASPSVSGSPIIIGNGNSAYTQSSFAGPSTTAYGFDGYCYNFTSVTTARPYTVLSTMNFDAEL